MKFEHHSVLLNESIEALAVKPDGIYVDATLGGGGHASKILASLSQKGKLIGIDRDPDAILFSQEKLSQFKDRLILANADFRTVKQAVNSAGFEKVDGIFADLGVSSYQIDHPSRGFSFKGVAPLDMRMGEGKLTAAKILNTYPQVELERIFRDYGEERYAKGISKWIVNDRQKEPFVTTYQLTGLIERFYRGKSSPKKIHPATKIYQALRIEVNDELGALQHLLEDSMKLLSSGGRLAIITFHSLEDRIVKHFLKEYAATVGKHDKYAKSSAPIESGKFKIITKKPILPSAEEIAVNPRSRSAKLRVAEMT